MTEPETLREWITLACRDIGSKRIMEAEEKALRSLGTWAPQWGSVAAELQRIRDAGLVAIEGDVVRLVPQRVERETQGSLF